MKNFGISTITHKLTKIFCLKSFTSMPIDNKKNSASPQMQAIFYGKKKPVSSMAINFPSKCNCQLKWTRTTNNQWRNKFKVMAYGVPTQSFFIAFIFYLFSHPCSMFFTTTAFQSFLTIRTKPYTSNKYAKITIAWSYHYYRVHDYDHRLFSLRLCLYF